MKLKHLLPAAAALLYACGSPTEKLIPAFTADERKLALVEYQDKKVTIGSFLDTMLQDAGDSTVLSLYSVKELRSHFLDNVIKPAVVLQEAYRRGFDRLPEVQEKVGNAREMLMASRLHEDAVREKYSFTDEELHRQYETHKAKYQLHPRIEMRHIQLKDGQRAAELMERIQAGERMGDLATAFSKEEYGQKNWGKSGNFPLGQGKYPAELERVLAGMKVGEIRGPVRTREGYHIVKLLERTDGEQMPFRRVLPQIKQDLSPAKEQARLQAFTDSLAGVYGLTVDEKALEAFGNPSDIVARIGDENIFVRDVAGAYAQLGGTGEMPPSARRSTLQALTAKLLIRRESYARGYDRDPRVVHLADVRARTILVKYFDKTEIDDRIRITDGELQEYYDNKRRRIQVRLFATAEQELIHQIRDALMKGETVSSITAVVKERAKTKLITWDGNEQDNRPLVDAAFALSPTNRFSDVISLPSPDNGIITHYVLMYGKLTVAPSKPFEQVRNGIYREVYARRRRSERTAYYERLYRDAHVRFYDDNMNLFIKRWIDYLQQGAAGGH